MSSQGLKGKMRRKMFFFKAGERSEPNTKWPKWILFSLEHKQHFFLLQHIFYSILDSILFEMSQILLLPVYIPYKVQRSLLNKNFGDFMDYIFHQ